MGPAIGSGVPARVSIMSGRDLSAARPRTLVDALTRRAGMSTYDANLLDHDYATFGTFNLNQGAGNALDRFLTPGGPRSLRVGLSRRFARSVSVHERPQ
jgi:hypothetical protein